MIVAKKAAATTAATTKKKENRLIRYLKEVRAEVRRVVWPSRQDAIRLTGIVLGVIVVMSAALGVIDWIFTKLFGLIIR